MLIVSDPTNSGTTRFFSVALKDQTGAPATPLQAFRTVFDTTPGQESVITPESAITVTGATLAFKTTDEENTIVDTGNATEKRRVEIRCTFAIGDEFTDFADYSIKRVAPPL